MKVDGMQARIDHIGRIGRTGRIGHIDCMGTDRIDRMGIDHIDRMGIDRIGRHAGTDQVGIDAAALVHYVFPVDQA